jgi:hypothetical protein
VCENRVLRKICGPKRDEITGAWSRLHNEPHNLYSSPYSIWVTKKNWMGGACYTYRREERHIQGFGGET